MENLLFYTQFSPLNAGNRLLGLCTFQIFWLENKPYMHDSKIIFGVWLFDTAWEISSQFLREWDKLWNHETHDKVEGLGKSVFHTIY